MTKKNITDITAEELKEKVNKEFDIFFGPGGETEEMFVPGRVNLIGEHIDYSGGYVMPMITYLGTYGKIKKNKQNKINVISLNMKVPKINSFTLKEVKYKGRRHWTDYFKGVLYMLMDEGYKIPGGFDILIYGNIPSGGGMSSSASIEVLCGKLISKLYGLNINDVDMAKICKRAESEYNGMNCGIMDQFAVSVGKANEPVFLNTKSLDYEFVDIKNDEYSFVVVNTKVKHSLVSSDYNDRRTQCLDGFIKVKEILRKNGLLKGNDITCLCDVTPDLYAVIEKEMDNEMLLKRVKHSVFENYRTYMAKKALEEKDFERFGGIMNGSHESLRDDFDVSCKELDFLQEFSMNYEGCAGSRMMGGGFGGCIISLVKNEVRDKYKEDILKTYKEKLNQDGEVYYI